MDSFIDVTADCVVLRALDAALKVKKEIKDKIDFRVGSYPIFGFKESEPERWDVFEEGAKKADFIGTLPEREPTVWAVHSLSISSYPEERFRKVLEGLKENNIGVFVCPTATLSNKQHRDVLVPMHNSITRVLELILEDIPVRIGTDNVQDFFSARRQFRSVQ